MIKAIHLPGAAFPQDRHDLLGSLCVGIGQDELAIVRERRCIGLDLLIRFPQNGLIVNSMFESLASQSFDGLVQVPIVVEYPNDRLVSYEPFREEPTDGGKFHVGALF
jgi:hypothetical protein